MIRQRTDHIISYHMRQNSNPRKKISWGDVPKNKFVKNKDENNGK